jgi:hypothetical protein
LKFASTKRKTLLSAGFCSTLGLNYTALLYMLTNVEKVTDSPSSKNKKLGLFGGTSPST